MLTTQMNVKDFFLLFDFKNAAKQLGYRIWKNKNDDFGKNDNKILKSPKRSDSCLNKWNFSEVAKRNRSRSLQIPGKDDICYVLWQYEYKRIVLYPRTGILM